jgi:hypothetical protein
VPTRQLEWVALAEHPCKWALTGNGSLPQEIRAVLLSKPRNP